MNTRQALVFVVAVSSAVTLSCANSGSADQQATAQQGSPTAQTDSGTPPMKTTTTTTSTTTTTTTASMTDASTSPAVQAGQTYSNLDNWLCRPGRDDACAGDLSTTIVAADGTLTPEAFHANPDAPIDCFYVYPTISNDATPNSDLVAGPEEKAVALAQFARFGSQCRLYAPMYRQVTLTSLRASIAGMPSTPDRTLGYNDIVDAWQYYLDHDNAGRGVVLVGHSQGSGVLIQLIHDHLDNAPLDKRLIAALLIGATISVPPNADVGGTFQNLPLCRSREQLGCVISYSSFRSDLPPTTTTSFSRASDPNLVGGCTNPAALGGGSAELHSYLTASGMVLSSNPTPPWVTPAKDINTPFVSVPGLLSGECVAGDRGSYLSITVHGDPSDPRADDIVGDVITNGQVQRDWGLHVIDMHLTMGNLVDVVQAKAAAYGARR
jgi:pimeloyl-ACP methyl ester carboxylesterase